MRGTKNLKRLGDEPLHRLPINGEHRRKREADEQGGKKSPPRKQQGDGKPHKIQEEGERQ
jgi:hypothetical protein